MKYNLVSDGDKQNITVFADGEMYVANQDHPNFKSIVAGVVVDDPSVVDLFDVAQTASKRFEALSERVSVANGRVYFDGDEVDNSLTRQIVRFIDEGRTDFRPLVNFFEKVSLNPQEHSRVQLFDWLSKHDFTLTPDGDLVGYKGVRKNSDGTLVSIMAGPAIVDGEAVNGNVPNEVGSVIEIARSAVQHNPSVGCASGLHVGTYRYASDFAQGAVLEVHVNPRDVVSVPTDCDWQKVRCSRYKIVKVIDTPYTSAVLSDEDEDDLVTCEDCGTTEFVQCCYDEIVCDDCGDRRADEQRGDEDCCVVCQGELCCDDERCDDCLDDADDDDLDVQDVTTATVWDTRQNYTKQERYPAGHPKAGQFKPRGV
jgi:hypothetical protein